MSDTGNTDAGQMSAEAVEDLVGRITHIELNELMPISKTNRSSRVCLAMARRVSIEGYFAVAEDFCQQATCLALTEEEKEEADWEYLLSRIRSGAITASNKEVAEFRKNHPDSPRIVGMEERLALARASRKTIGSHSIWTSSARDWGYGLVEQEKAILRNGAAILARDKVEALEFAHGAVALYPNSVQIQHMLAQRCSSFGLNLSAYSGYKYVAQHSSNVFLRTDAAQKAARCLIAAWRFAEAQAEIVALKKSGASDETVEAVRLFYNQQKALADAGPEARASLANEVALGAAAGIEARKAHETFAQNYLTQSGKTSGDLKYPLKMIAVVHHRSAYVNFLPLVVRQDGKWYVLSDQDRTANFPHVGEVNVLYPDSSDMRALKDERLVSITLEAGELHDGPDPVYRKQTDVHFGRQVGLLSDVGALVVHPLEKEYSFAGNIFVTIDPDGRHVGGEAALANEEAVLAVGDGFVGPFRLKADARGRLYISRVQKNQMGEIWKFTANGDDGFVRFRLTIKGSITLDLCLATLLEDGAFEVGPCPEVEYDCVVDMLQRQIPSGEYVRTLRSVIESSSVVPDEKMRRSLISDIDDLIEAGNFKESLTSHAVESIIAKIDGERGKTEQPVTRAIIDTVLSGEDDAGLRARIDAERNDLEKKHKAELEKANAEFEAQKAGLETRLQAMQSEVAGLDSQISAKREYWMAEFKEMARQMKLEAQKEIVSPFLDGNQQAHKCDPAPESEKPAKRPKTDFHARAVSLARAAVPRNCSTTELRKILVEYVMKKRGYDHDTAVNLLVSLANNFLTVFAGEPGCGKTSVCGILADTLGISNLSRFVDGAHGWDNDGFCDRFLHVAVERGWTGNRDLLGYFNPLTGSFTATDHRRYESFRQLDAEARHDSFEFLPFVMLLDEANLSPMEYYWSSFMGLCDMTESRNREFALGDNTVVRVPDHLRFLATINTDDTTESLSPRLIDRAWVIRLPETDGFPAARADDGGPMPPVTWNQFQSAFGAAGEVANCNDPVLAAVMNHFARIGRRVSMRSKIAIMRYVSIAKILLDGGERAAVDHAVAQKILPAIRGSGPAYREWLDGLLEICRPLPVSYGALKSVIFQGEANLDFYRFL